MEQQKIVPQNLLPEDEINLLEILKILVKRRKLIATTVLGITLATGLVGLFLPPKYESMATLMPVESDQSGLAGALGALGGGLGGVIANQAGISSSASQKFVTILSSRTVTESVVRKLDLLPVLFHDQWDESTKSWKKPVVHLPWKSAQAPTMQDAVRAMRGIQKVSEEKSSVVTVGVETGDPDLSARIANAYVAELEAYLKTNALSTAKRNRIFIEKQLSDVQKDLARHELDLKNFQERHRLVSLDAQAEAAVNTYATLKSQLIAKEIQRDVLGDSAGFADIQSNILQSEIAGLKRELQKLESGGSSGGTISFKDAPELGRQFAQLKRDLLVKQKVFEVLVQQYEMAKIQEAKEDISFQIIDPAVPPDEKSSPRLVLMVLVAFMASCMLGALMALVFEFIAKHKHEFRAHEEPVGVAGGTA